MWTATLDSIEKDGLIVRYSVTLTNGTTNIKKVYEITNAQSVKSLVQGTINQLNNLYESADLEKLGDIDLSVVPII